MGEYALRALLQLTQHEDEWPIPGPRIAASTRIPGEYLSTLLRVLVRAHVLEASPGRNGGFRLGRAPAEVYLFDVLAPFESALTNERRACPFGDPVCGDENPCGGYEHWKLVLETYSAFVRETTLLAVAGVRPRRRRPPWSGALNRGCRRLRMRARP